MSSLRSRAVKNHLLTQEASLGGMQFQILFDGLTDSLKRTGWKPDAVSNGGLPQLWVRLVLRVRSGGIRKGASFQVRPTQVSMRFASVVTGLGMA